MKQVQDAAKLLARRYDQSSLRTAAHMSMIGNERQQGLMYTQKVVNQHLTNNEWAQTYSFLKGKTDLQVGQGIYRTFKLRSEFVVLFLCHECLRHDTNLKPKYHYCL